MRCHHLNLFLFILIVSMFALSHGDPIPRKGKGRKSFGTGLLTGALAGAVVGNVLTNKAHASKSESNKHVTTIQNGPTQPNGCFEQTIRESDPSNSKKFVETVSLVCPSAAPLSPVSAVVHTPISVATPLSQAPQTTTVNMPAQLSVATAAEPIQIGLANTSSQFQPTLQLPQVDTASSISQNNPQQTLQSPPQMVPQLSSQINPHFTTQQIPQMTTQTAFPQAPKVYVISKRTEYYKKKSAAIGPILGSKFLINFSLILLMVFMY